MGRRVLIPGQQLITMEKVTLEEYGTPTFGLLGNTDELEEGDARYAPAHKNFRDKYFRGFKKGDEPEIDGQATALANEGGLILG